MKLKKSALTGCAAFTLAVLANPAGAATATTQVETLLYSKEAPSHTYVQDPDATPPTYGPEVNSFYNKTMGYKGWVHMSVWGYMKKLKKGIPVTITAEAFSDKAATTPETGFHPGIAVWRNAGTAPIDYVRLGDDSMPYDQWGDVVENSAEIDIPDKPSKTKSLKMYFVTNGVDRDGWDQPADWTAQSMFDQSLINRILDGEAGKVSVTFTPPVTGTYKFVVGGMNPASTVTGRRTVKVTVAIPD